MANLKAFKVDSKAIETGQWVRVDDAYDDLELLVRGYTDAYTDYRARKSRRVAAMYGGDVNAIPSAKAREILVDALVEHVIRDVRNLSDEAGNPINFDQFVTLLRDPDYHDLVVAVIRAAAKVGTANAVDLENTKKK